MPGISKPSSESGRGIWRFLICTIFHLEYPVRYLVCVQITLWLTAYAPVDFSFLFICTPYYDSSILWFHCTIWNLIFLSLGNFQEVMMTSLLIILLRFQIQIIDTSKSTLSKKWFSRNHEKGKDTNSRMSSHLQSYYQDHITKMALLFL